LLPEVVLFFEQFDCIDNRPNIKEADMMNFSFINGKVRLRNYF